MGLFNNFPYMDLSNLNLDFVLKKLKDLTNYTQSAEQAAESAEQSASSAQQSAESAEQSASSAQQSAESAEGSADTAQNYAEHIADPVGGLVTGWLDENITPTTPPVDASLTIQGAAADAKAAGDAIAALRREIETNYGLTPEVKHALMDVASHIGAWTDANAQTYISNLYNALYTEHTILGWFYPFNGSLRSEGTEDFGFTGVEEYTAGRTSGTQAYFHEVTTEGDSSTDRLGIKATGLSTLPNLSGAFTIALWHASVTASRGHPFAFSKYVTTTNPSTAFESSFTRVSEDWNISHSDRASRKYCGITLWWANATLTLAVHSSESTPTASTQFIMTPPSDFDSTQWHHYALTREGTSYYFFIDGELIFSFESSRNPYQSNQIAIGNIFGQTSATATSLTATAYGDKVQDLYITNECKWTSDFDPSAIIYY